jgi:Ca2+-binding RTX toxin-like protein
MKSLLLAGGLASGLVVGMLALPVPAVAAEMCHGQAATLVGSPEVMTLVGTDGDDVIVTNGSWVIYAGDGNDRVCVTGRSGLVYAGFGDDVVDSTASSSGRSSLGPGADTYLGGPGSDYVKAAGNPGGGRSIGDQWVDVIDTGAGAATIYSGAPGKANADTIAVGDGTSTLYWSGYQTGGEVGFGAGRHRMKVSLGGDGQRDWLLGNGVDPGVDNALVHWTGVVGDITVRAFPDSATLTVLGSAAPELLVLPVVGSSVTADLGGGADTVRAPCTTFDRAASLDAGPGRDSLSVWCASSLALDLRKTRLVVDGQQGKAATVRGWEAVQLHSPQVTARGDGKANTLTAHACQAILEGQGGNDVLRLSLDSGDSCTSHERRLFGGAGADRLVGSGHGDVLIGGTGRDVADGRGGNDRCQAEVRRSCERR